MIKANIDKLIEKIAKLSGLNKEEIERRIEAKREKLSGLISFEGAAQIVAAELGIKFDNIKLSIGDLIPGMKKISVIGKIIDIYGIRKYKKQDKELKVASFLLADETGSIRVVLWDTNQIRLIEEGEIKKGSVVEINNAQVRGDEFTKELHLTNISQISPSTVNIERVSNVQQIAYAPIKKLRVGSRVEIRGTLIQIFNPYTFNFCRSCNSKVEGTCKEHGEKDIEKRLILAFVIDDGSESIRCVAFNDAVLSIFKISSIEELIENFNELSNRLLGTELSIEGRVRKNSFRDEKEFVVDKIKEVDVKRLIEELNMAA